VRRSKSKESERGFSPPLSLPANSKSSSARLQELASWRLKITTGPNGHTVHSKTTLRIQFIC